MELWRSVPGYPHYKASSSGRVCSLHGAGRIMRQPTSNNGYLIVGLCEDGKRTSMLVHKAVLLAFAGPAPAGTECRHRDGNKLNNAIDNLEWATHAVNMRDKAAHGTELYGSDRPWLTGLSSNDVADIRGRYKPRVVTQRMLAREYGTTQQTISRIIRGEVWMGAQCQS